METGEKLKLLAEMRLFGVKKAVKLGDSYALILPRAWLEHNAMAVNGDYYLSIKVDGNELTVSPLNKEDIDAISIKEK